MEALTIAYICIGLLFVALAGGIHVGVALGLLGVAGMYFGIGESFAFGQLETLPFAVANNYGFSVLPLFILMGVFAERSGITREVFTATDNWLRPVRGGLYMVVVCGSAIFAAVSGSTTVNSVVFTRLAFPEMVRHGYSRSLSIGCIAAAGSFAAMIPPSITIVIYAIMTEQSIGRLLLAGVTPGVLSAVAYILLIVLLVRLRPEVAPSLSGFVSLKEKIRSLFWVWPIVVLLMLVLGGIYAGVFPPSGAGAVGAFGALLVALLYSKGRFQGWFMESLREGAAISCVIFLILIGGLIFSRMLVVTGVIGGVVEFITAIAGTPLLFILLVAVTYIVLGCFLDTTSLMVVTLPFLFPVAEELNIDPIWFGIIVVKLIEISVITPPIGINLFAVMSAVDKDTRFIHVVRGVIPFLGVELILLGLLIAYPGIATWLPELMMR